MPLCTDSGLFFPVSAPFSGLYESRALLSGKPKQRACIHYLIRSLKGLIGLRVLWFLFHFAMLMEEEPII